ncbi:MAG: Coupling protein VirD4, ATPase required for T-DNA transfer [Nitrospira sp.]|jgi:type IV secretion system protein VirD4|nr:Coupling protein VirD4, ATPase required for T-DNA transfer [Nitrospira sp.]
MSRKGMRIAIALLLYLPLGLCGANALAGAVFTLANKQMPDALSLSSWLDSWRAYAEDPVQRKRLQFSAAVGGFVGFGLPTLLMLSLTNQRKPLHGEARFASHDEIQQAGLYGERGLIIGKIGRRYLVYGGQEFVLLAAPTRSGKGVSIVLPNLLHYDDSVVVLDIKMENFAYTSKFRQAHGHRVFLFNPFSTDGQTHRWNPLDGVDRDPNRRVGVIQAIGQVLYPTEQIKEAFWNESARNLFLGLTLSIIETPSLPCSLGEVLRQASGKGQPIKDYLQDLISTRAKSGAPLSDDCTAALHRFCATSENTMAGILATLTAPLTIFSNPIVDAATSETDFDLKQVRAQRMSIYVGIPANRLSDAALLVNLFFSQLIHYNTVELPATNPTLKHQCLVILDEFPAIGRVNILAKAVGFMAGYNLRLLPIIQSLSQLESVYGEKDARTFVTNHACQILFAPREQRDAQHYSQMLGTYTAEAISTGTSRPLAWGNGKQASSSSTRSDQARPLLLPQEVKELGDQRAILNLVHTKPILCDKARFYADPVFIDRLKRISPSLASVGKRLPTQAELEEAAFVRRELSVEIPRLDLELHRAKVERRVRPVQPDEPIDVSKLAMDLTTLPPVVARDPPTLEEVNDLVDAFVAQLQWSDKVETGVGGVEREAGEVGIEQKVRQGAGPSERMSRVSKEEKITKNRKSTGER